MTDLYLRLDYRQYKHLEQQLRDWDKIETSHTSVDGYYHKALRLDIGEITLEIQGPAVRAPIRGEPAEPVVDECPRCHRDFGGSRSLYYDVLNGIRCSGCNYRVGEMRPGGANWDEYSGVVIKDAWAPVKLPAGGQ
jgi:hypothetical protein